MKLKLLFSELNDSKQLSDFKMMATHPPNNSFFKYKKKHVDMPKRPLKVTITPRSTVHQYGNLTRGVIYLFRYANDPAGVSSNPRISFHLSTKIIAYAIQ